MLPKAKTTAPGRILTYALLAAAAVLLLDVGCVFRRITGIPCPGCGMTRAHLAALRLDFRGAFYYHPLWFLPVPLILCQAVRPGGFFRKPRWNTAAAAVLLVLVLGVYVLRMVRCFPDVPPMEYQPDNLLRQIFSLLCKLRQNLNGGIGSP